MSHFTATVMMYNARPYWVATGQYTYATALLRAGQMRYRGLVGHLATVTTPGEYNFLYWTMNTRGALVALTETLVESTWAFSAGPELGMPATATNFTMWAQGEPDGGVSENCAVFDVAGFSDVNCNEQRYSFVVEFECPVTDQSNPCLRKSGVFDNS